MEGAIFAQLKKTLKGIDIGKLEWSLKVNKEGSFIRPKPLFWVGQREHPGNQSAFQAMGELLIKLNCPEDIRAIQQQLSPTSNTQGIRPNLSDVGTHCIYIDHITDEGQKKIEAFHWKAGREVKRARYHTKPLNSTDGIETPLAAIHPELKECFAHCCENEVLRNRSVSGYQYINDVLQEVYLTYFWHPDLGLIIDYLPVVLKNHLRQSTYENLPFRHFGFSTTQAKDPEMTFYFSGPIRDKWPNCFDEHQRLVLESSRMLVKEIEVFFGGRYTDRSSLT